MSQVDDLRTRMLRLDLGALVALDVLLEERNVTRAARRLGVTQSAMSHTLTRLRQQLGDPLLVRGGNRMLATPRADAMALPLRSALLDVVRAVEASAPFAPETAQRAFRIASPDPFDTLVLPGLMARLIREAPDVRLTVVPGIARLHEALETGELDLAVVPRLVSEVQGTDVGPSLGEDLRQRQLIVDRHRAFVRNEHPILAHRRRVSAKAFAALDHVLVSPTGRGPGIVDAFLAERGLARRVRLRVPQFDSAFAVAAETDLVLTAPGALAGRAVQRGLSEVDLDFDLPAHTVHVVWHPRLDADPGHRWLREQLTASVTRVR